jgi:antitoxin (DNA-binding transcriptional repressor) of toxin-antitoxin stability system
MGQSRAAKRVTSTDARTHFCELVRLVEDTGDVLLITRRGRPMVELRRLRQDGTTDAPPSSPE